tara:strand:- start:54 stop:995 length:942 start_codon:yes stop_codon:yes gene_type:complete
MQHDLFKKLTENEQSNLRDWIQIQTDFDFKYNEKNVDAKNKKVLVKNLINDSCDFLENLSLKLFQSEYFVKCLIEQKSKKLKGEYIARYISKELLENDTFLESVISLYPQLIKSIGSVQKKNSRIWELALLADGEMIQYLSKECFDTKLINLAVDSSPRAIRFIPVDSINRDLCLNAIEKSAKSYLDIPETFQNSFDFCKVACNRNLNVWEYLNDPLKYDKHILEFCLTKSGIEGIYHSKDLHKSSDFLGLIFETGDKKRQRMILAYMENEILFEYAIAMISVDQRNFSIFKQCALVGKKSIVDRLKAKFNIN